MRIFFEKLKFPLDSDGYHAVTDTHANVWVSVDETTFVSMEQLLVVEFAGCINRWLVETSGRQILPFYYKSMDEEEEPLLALVPDEEGNFAAESCWSLRGVRKLGIEEIQAGFSEFLSNLSASLQAAHRFDLRSAFAKLS